MDEENAAMYRMMARPSEKIYISWSMTDTEGRDTSPSPVIDSLRMMFPRIDSDGLIRKDIISMGRSGSLNAGGPDKINTAGDGMRHLINRIKDANAPDEPDALTRAMLHWYADNRKDELDTMLRAAAYDNVQRPLGPAAAKELFCRSDGSLSLSASSIGNYIDCPFRYFIDRGLRPKEERIFASDARSVGDVYHECLMAVARQIMNSDEIPDDDSLEELVTAALDELSEGYLGGLFISTGSEEYRMSRIREICASAAKAMAAQLASGSVVSASFEEPFGRHAKFGPLKISAGDGEVYVEGKIDRADVMDIGGENRVRIIDYKTGSDKLDLWKMRQGYKMQLMIYMISATSGDLTPAGMFYFNIKDPIESINDKSKNQIDNLLGKEAEDEFKLKGAFINEEGVLGAMPEKVLSSVKGAISREEYEETRSDVIARIEETAEGILGGKIGIHPLRVDNRLACGYCSYKSVCRRDRGYVKNSYRPIRPKPKEKE
jgi:ATP-dependent helicase/nuclease subunit B